jgi:hypothetical protein
MNSSTRDHNCMFTAPAGSLLLRQPDVRRHYLQIDTHFNNEIVKAITIFE